MQTKINKIKEQVSNKLNESNINFSVEDLPITSADEQNKLNGFKFETAQLTACIVPNFNKNRPEFLILNENLIQHLVSEGFDDDFINENGKIWLHLETVDNFIKYFLEAHSIQKKII